MIRNLYLAVLYAVLFVSSSLANSNFQINGSRIIDPDGNEFVPRGVNVQGMKWVWPGTVVPQADLIINAWNFNILRVNCKLYDSYWNGENVSAKAHYQTIESMAAIVDAFTLQKVVVMFEFHDKTGSYYSGNELEDLKDAYREMCSLWKDNPYVWFNIMNEPGGGTPDLSMWVNMHRSVIEVIRDEMQASNVIVVDAHYWGQDIGAWNANPVPQSASSILSRGKDLLHFNDRNYVNIMFSLHVYDQWNRGTPEQIEFKLHDYFLRVKESGLAVMIGEFGTNQADGNLYFPDAYKATMKVAPAHGVGLIWWHWYGGDALKLTTSGNGNGGNINSIDNPTNLTWPGRLFWEYARFTGNRPPFIAISYYASTQIIQSGNELTIRIAAADYDDGIQQVDLYINSLLVHTFTKEPYEYLISDIQPGRYVLEAVATDTEGNESSSSRVSVNVSQSPHRGIVLFVSGSYELTLAEDRLYDQILKAGFRVVQKIASDVREIDGSSRVAVVLSSSVTNAAVGNMFAFTAVPLLTASPALLPALKLTGSDAGKDFGKLPNQTQLRVADETHPVANGLSGLIDVYLKPADIAYGVPAYGASVVITTLDDPAKASLFVYPAKAALFGIEAPAPRAAWFASVGDNVELTETSLTLFRNTLEWLMSKQTAIGIVNAPVEPKVRLQQNYPNPVRAFTTISYHLKQSGFVKLICFDMRGNTVDVLVQEHQLPGSYEVTLHVGEKYTSGMYYYTIHVGAESNIRMMLVY